MDIAKMLKPGDPCPCCGQPIKTRDPEILRLLTYIRDSGRLVGVSTDFRKEDGQTCTPT